MKRDHIKRIRISCKFTRNHLTDWELLRFQHSRLMDSHNHIHLAHTGAIILLRQRKLLLPVPRQTKCKALKTCLPQHILFQAFGIFIHILGIGKHCNHGGCGCLQIKNIVQLGAELCRILSILIAALCAAAAGLTIHDLFFQVIILFDLLSCPASFQYLKGFPPHCTHRLPDRCNRRFGEPALHNIVISGHKHLSRNLDPPCL